MIILLALALVWSAYIIWRVRIMARLYQLEGYQFQRFINWLKTHRERYASDRYMIGFVGGVGIAQVLIALGVDAVWLHFLWWTIVGFFVAYPEPVKEVKKKFVWTQRATRLTVTAFVVGTAINLLAALALGLQIEDVAAWQLLAVSVVGLLTFAVAPLLLPMGNSIMYPVESSLRRGFREKARRKLKQSDVKVIGITGSYGKTSTKVYLAHILSGKFRVLATPKSYNTLMGICIVINNDLDLEYGYDFFITEMGAYVRGEIAEICELVKPETGILIAIGPQHLERFGSIENVELAKYELIEALPQNGVGVFNVDDERVKRAYEKDYPDTRYAVTVQGEESPRFAADNIQHTVHGLKFDVTDRATNETRTFNTRLIGLHNVTNILLATATARHYGMSLNEIAMRVATLEPEEHRLNQRILPGGVTILDDAYNTNPIGARNALEVLGLYTNGRRILITPGIVELGGIQAAENEKLGRQAAEHCTDIVLVKSRETPALKRGVESTDFDRKHLHIFETTQEAIQWYQQTVRPGDTVLFLNDLSDNYL
ncbi:MAG: UDP-N-acetylmuramoyl-tripeptide--D-alanyl-D-alanine ligase [Chloroflexi bacterium]|nr:UDP-N-acetylmuramoyl-tripeptide--D-alanyl-D-alanine ligase [Chloroflexota bacterium]